MNKTIPNFQYYGRRLGKPISGSKKELLETSLKKYLLEPSQVNELTETTPLYLEIGFGNGDHLYKQAMQNRNVQFIGAEPFINGVAHLLSNIEAEKISNVKIFNDDIRKILPLFKDNSLDRVFILFPDPWPKSRHNKRRLINTEFLNLLSTKMKKDAKLIFATDHRGYATHFLSYILINKNFAWLAKSPNEALSPPEFWINTKYELKAISKKIKCMYFVFENKL